MNYELLARELVRAIRGRRSQAALARRLQYRTNVVHCWEAGRHYPTAARFFWAASRAGVDLSAALGRFFRTPPRWLGDANLARPEGVVVLLQGLRGRIAVTDIAARTGMSRFSVARVLKGQTEPRLPDLLRLVEALSQRPLDFVAALVDPDSLPSIAAAHRSLEAARRAAHDAPVSQLVVRAMELLDYAALPEHEVGWIARRLNLTLDEERDAIELLAAAGLIRKRAGRWVPAQTATVDTRQNPQRARATRAHWARFSLERLQTGQAQDGIYAYNLFGVSQADYERLQQLQRNHFEELRAIVANSEPIERVVLANHQLVPVDGGG